MKNLCIAIMLSILTTGVLFSQTKSQATQLYEMANSDGKITKREAKLIEKILENDSETISISYRQPKKRLRKDLNPMTYIMGGLELGAKHGLFRLQGRIIEDMNEVSREILKKR